MKIRTLPARKALAGVSLVAIGLVGGGTLAVVGTASAADSTSTTAAATSDDSGRSMSETALTGDTVAKVKAAVLAEYAGATFDRVETDDGGVYEAHISTAAGEELTVELDAAFAVTGTEAHGGGGHRGDGGGSGEPALTGDTLAKVKAAVLAKYAGATFDRVETDDGGVYEAHRTTAAGEELTVELDAAFSVTGTE